MDLAPHIQVLFKNPELWKVFFISAAMLGIYLSIIITGFQRIRKQHTLKLAGFLMVISMLLLQLTQPLENFQCLALILNSLGAASLLLIGPLSSQLTLKEKYPQKDWKSYLQILPCLAAAVLIQVHERFLFWVYLAGGLYSGIYLIVQLVKMQRGGFRENLQTWIGKFILIQLAMYLLIIIAGIACPAVSARMIASICLSTLIVVIWVRLMHTAISLFIR